MKWCQQRGKDGSGFRSRRSSLSAEIRITRKYFFLFFKLEDFTVASFVYGKNIRGGACIQRCCKIPCESKLELIYSFQQELWVPMWSDSPGTEMKTPADPLLSSWRINPTACVAHPNWLQITILKKNRVVTLTSKSTSQIWKLLLNNQPWLMHLAVEFNYILKANHEGDFILVFFYNSYDRSRMLMLQTLY